MTTVLQTSSAGTTILQDGTTTIVTQTVQGVKGDTGADGKDGDSVAELEPRVQALEENTDGLVDGASPLDYYLLARG